MDIKNLCGQKKPNFIWPFFKNKKRPKELKKGQKLQIWPQKIRTGNPAEFSTYSKTMAIE